MGKPNKKLKKTFRFFVIYNLIAAIVILSVVFFTDVKKDFAMGMLYGLISTWLVFGFLFYREFKKPTYMIDERLAEIKLKAGFWSFFVCYLLSIAFVVLNHIANFEVALTMHQLSMIIFGIMSLVFAIIMIIMRILH